MTGTLTTGEIIVALAGSSAVSGGIGALLGRRVNAFKVFTEAYIELAKRVRTLEERAGIVEGERDEARDQLSNERAAHTRTAGLLRSALQHIRAWVRWADGDRAAPTPPMPDELAGRF